METYEFDAMMVDKQGNVTTHRRMKAKYISEDLGNGLPLEMLEIPAGKFLMGSRSETEKNEGLHEQPQHEVSVSRFFIGKYEITQAQWIAVAKLPRITRDLDPNPSTFTGDGKLPVQNVSWWDAVEFCERLSRATGRTYRLPTEAEWEYACRAGTTTPFYFGETLSADLVNYDANYPYGAGSKGMTRKRPNPVGNLSAPNAFGVNNSHGNMDEWVLDPWHENYAGAPTDGSVWGVDGDTSFRVARGGSWYDGGDNCRSASRDKNAPDLKLPFIGFRVVMVAP
jgi:formylglycine-generating enzyme required for sulfatase activity